MKFWREPGPVFLPLCQGALDVVEVCYHPWNHEMYREELSRQALQLFPADASLHGRDGNTLVHLLEFPLREGYHTGFCVNCPPHDLLHTGPVALPHLEILHTHWVLELPGQGQKDPFEGPYSAIEDLALSFRPTLYRCDHVIHIKVYMGEAIQGVGRARACLGDIGNIPVSRYRKQHVHECAS